MSIYEVIGQNIRKYRVDKGLSQEQLAYDMGTSTSHLRKLEKGKGNPTIKTLEGIGRSLDMDFLLLFEPKT